MKFLCPSCKAKYQIADEKVAGRSVRMKCRKCGHVIQVTSADAVASSSAPPPDVDLDKLFPDEPAPAVSAPKAAPLPVVAAPAEAKGAEKAKPGTQTPSTKAALPTPSTKAAVPVQTKQTLPLGQMPPAPSKSKGPVPARPAAGTAAPATSSRVAMPPKPSGLSAPRIADKPAAPSLRVANKAQPVKPGVAPPPRGGTPGPAPLATLKGLAPVQRLGDLDEDEQTRIASPGGLASAFSAAVTEHAPAHVTDPLAMPGDEWFVGINGVPVGPIKLSELRTKAATGAITKESLVWRDGFEEWRPLKSFPELVAIVEEGLSSTRTAGPFDAAAAKLGVLPSGTLNDPFAAPAASPSNVTPGGAVTGTVVVTDDLESAGLRRRSGTSPMVWLAMVVAIMFGVTLGFVFFGRPQPVAEKPDAPAPSVTAAPAPPPPVAANASQTDEIPVTGDPKAPKSGSSGTKVTTKTETDSKLTGGLKGLGLSGLSAGGPKGPNDSTGSTGSAGGQLDTGQLQSAVARYTPAVKRSCWQPALDTRDKDAPTSARVAVAITIGPSGTVQNVTANGDPKGYRGLANCITGRVRGWQFPPSGGSTTVNVPFVFVAQ